MSMNNKGLGRGLNALFGTNPVAESPAPDSSSPLINVSVDALESNPWQPRLEFSEDSLNELANSIRSQGILQPLLVRPSSREGFYQIVAGERRWRAARLAGLAVVPVLCRILDDTDVMVATIIENIQRDNLNPMEEAKGLATIKQVLNLSVTALAEKVGKSHGAISNSLRLIKLDPETQEAIVEGALPPSHARLLLNLDDPEAIIALRERILDEDMTFREVEEAVKIWNDEKHFPWENEEGEPEHTLPPAPRAVDPTIKQLATRIGQTLNCKAKISGDSEKGHISLNYESNAQLYELLEKLGLTLDTAL